jgi:hypothetical protein
MEAVDLCVGQFWVFLAEIRLILPQFASGNLGAPTLNGSCKPRWR